MKVDNTVGEMEVFVRTARLQSFSAAGRLLRMSPSAVSKLVTRLEERLKTRLVVRTTRSLQLTPEGEVYLERAQRILDDIRETEQVVSTGAEATPRGRLRVSVSVAFGVRYIVPLVPEFLARYPLVQLDLSLTDGIIDIVEERADVAIRSGDLRDTSLKARKLMDSRRIIVAAPAYLERMGVPENPAALDRQNCMTFNFRRTWEEWPFRDPDTGLTFSKVVNGNIEVNNGPTVRNLCLAGVGLARVGAFHVQPDIDAGLLVPVLEAFNPGDVEDIHAVYPGHPHLASRIRALIDFLVERI
jgi:DNA-binding transcriptional LysR family regulator